MGRRPCCSKEGLNKGAWTVPEDALLAAYIRINGEGNWTNLPTRAGLKRCGKSCRLRWLNYLHPDIKRGNISDDEEDLIIRLHRLLGNRWSLIAGRLPGRTDNEIKNYWNTTLSRKVDGVLQTSVKLSKHGLHHKYKAKNTNIKLRSSKPPHPPQSMVQTKAPRPIKLVPALSSPTDSPSIISTFQNSQTPKEFQHDSPNTAQEHDISEVEALKSCCKEHAIEDYSSNNEFNKSEFDYSLCVSDAIYQDWTSSDFLEGNAALDLDSFMSFLNDEEWPYVKDSSINI